MRKKPLLLALALFIPILLVIIYITMIDSDTSNSTSPAPANEDNNDQVNAGDNGKDPVEKLSSIIKITTPSSGSITTDQTPSLSGTFSHEEEATIELQFLNKNNQVVQTGKASVANGIWTYTPSSNLPYGKYEIKATFNNNSISLLSSLTVAKNKNLSISISGNGSVYTNKFNPIISGTTNAIDGVNVFVTINNTSSVTNVKAGTWELQWPDILLEGKYTISVSVEEQGHKASDSATVIVDTTSPYLSMEQQEEQISNNPTPTISGRTNEKEGSTVSVLIGDRDFQATVQSNGVWSITTEELQDGDYDVIASISDKAGNISTQKQKLTIDTTGPVISFNSPSYDSLLNDQTPKVSGTVAEGNSVIVQFINKSNRIIYTEQVKVQQTNWSFTPTRDLPDGSYTIIVTGKDKLNNESHKSLTTTIDSTSPTLTFNRGSSNITNEISPTIKGTTDERDGAEVTIDIDGTSYRAIVKNGTWSITPDQLLDNTYKVVASISDKAGNKTVATQSLTIDTTPPMLTIASGKKVSTSNNHPILAGETDAPNGTVVTIQLNNEEYEAIVKNGEWKLYLRDLADGKYTVKGTITDEANNTASVGQQLTIDTTPPTVEITSLLSGKHTNNAKPAIAGRVVDGKHINLVIFDGEYNQIINEVLELQEEEWTFEFKEPLADGKYIVKVTAYDEVNNQQSTTNTFYIDTTEPEVTVTNPVNQATITDRQPLIEGTSIRNSEVIIVVTKQSDIIIEKKLDTNGSGKWNYKFDSELEDGSYLITVSATDKAGNKGDEASTFIIDSTPPELSVVSPSNNSIFHQSDITITGRANPESVISVVLNNGETNKVTSDRSGVWAYNVSDPKAMKNIVTVFAEDEHGNTSNPVTLSFTAVEESAVVFEVTSNKTEILADGTDNTIFTAKVTDDSGQPIENVEVTFDAPIGSFPDGDKVMTNTEGIAEVKYISTNMAESSKMTYRINAKANVKNAKIERQVSIMYKQATVANKVSLTGLLLNEETEEIIESAVVELYFADTKRNANAGRLKDTLVDITNNPQSITTEGKYNYEVYPNADYYLVVKTEEDETVKSSVLIVDEDIVEYNVRVLHNSSANPTPTKHFYNYLLICITILLIGSPFLIRKLKK